MTHLVLGLSNYLNSPISYILNTLYNITNQIMNSIERSNNIKAQYEVARMLHREYPNESFDYIYNIVKQGTINELVK